MLLILREREIYLIDRDNNVFAAPQFHFPQRKILKEHIYDTLIDGVRACELPIFLDLLQVNLGLMLSLFISLEWNERVIFGQWSDEREHREELLEATFRKSGYVHKGKKGLLVS